MNITQRDKNVLLAGIIFVFGYLLFFFIAEPIYKKQTKCSNFMKNISFPSICFAFLISS
jgi:hypothetical protein